MKLAAEIVNLRTVQKDLSDPVRTDSGSPERQADKVIDYLFLSLSAKYGHKWGSLFSDDEVMQVIKDEWARSLADISPVRLRAGLDKCVIEYPDWPPTVGQFIKLCERDPDEFGLPSLADAWLQICSEDVPYTHGVVLAMRNDKQCNSYTWRLYPEDKAHKLFKPVYQRYIDQALSGKVFELPVMLEDRVDEPVTWDERKSSGKAHMEQEMSRIRELLK